MFRAYYPNTFSRRSLLSWSCLFLDAINALTSLPSPECDARIKVRLGFLVWFDFHSKVLRVARHTVSHSFCIADGSPNNQQLWQYGFFIVGEKQSHCRSISIASKLMWLVVFFRENAFVAILAADIKRSFWVAWTMMNNCRSQFGWKCAQLKESAIRRVFERQV